MSDGISHEEAVMSTPKPRWRLRALAVTALGAFVLLGCNATVTGQTLTVVHAQEDSWYSNGDEPYVAVIQFRVTPGVANSTQVRYLGHLQEIAQNMYDGSSAPIPPAMAATSFDNVNLVGFSDVLAGKMPEIVGAVTVAMESDASPWSAIDGIMNDVTSELDRQLRAQIETLTLGDLLNPDQVAGRLSEAATKVEAAASPSFWRGVGIWFQSFGDPDDTIGFKVLFFVAASGDLANAVDAKLATGLPSDVIGQSLKTGPLDVDYSDGDALYRIHWNVTLS
jgi:hypothetical protein